MKILSYNTKNENGQYVALKYYPTDEEAAKIIEILLMGRNRPQQIEFRGNILKTANIEIFNIEIFNEDSSGSKSANNGRYDLANPEDRDTIKQFGIEYQEWRARHPKITINIFEAYLQDRGCVARDKQGNATYPITDTVLFSDLWKRHNAWDTLCERRAYSQEQEEKSVEALYDTQPHEPQQAILDYL